MRKAIMIVLAVVVLAGLGLWLAHPDLDQLKEPIRQALEKRLHRPVTLGEMGLSLSPLAVKVQNVAVDEPAGGAHFVTASELYVRAGVAALLRGRVEVERVLLRGAKVELRCDKAGRWNYADLMAGAGEPSGEQGGPSRVSFNEIAIERFVLGVSNPQRSEYGPLDVTLTAAGADKWKIKAKLAAGTLLPAPVDVQAEFENRPEELIVSTLALKMDEVALSGAATVHTKATPATIEANLKSGDTALEGVLKMLHSPTKGKGRISLQVTAKGPLAGPVVSGQVSLRGTTIETPELAGPLEVIAADLQFRLDEKLQARAEGTIDTLGGKTNGVFTTRLAGAATSTARVHLEKVDASALMAITNPSLKNTLTGTLSGDADLSLKSVAGGEAARGINGTLKFDLGNGRLNGVRMLKELTTIAQFAGIAQSNESFTKIEKLAGTLQIHDGVATTEDLQLVFEGGSLTAAGNIGLADRTLDLKVTATLPATASAQSGSSAAAGFLSTFLKSPNGDVVIPAQVTGTFDKPRFQPDAARMAKMKLAPLLQGKQSTQSAVEGVKSIFDSFRKKKQ